MTDSREIEIHFESKEDGFEVVATLGDATLTLYDRSIESSTDLDTLVAALPGILNAVVERLEDLAEEETDRG